MAKKSKKKPRNAPAPAAAPAPASAPGADGAAVAEPKGFINISVPTNTFYKYYVPFDITLDGKMDSDDGSKKLCKSFKGLIKWGLTSVNDHCIMLTQYWENLM